MSLLVNLVSKSPDVCIEDFEEMLTRQDLFGFEVWRKTLWGHKYLEKLGCVLLPKLKHGDLYLYDNDLENIKQEFEKVLLNLSIIQDITNIDSETIKQRIYNALEAVRVAQLHVDKIGIVLW